MRMKRLHRIRTHKKFRTKAAAYENKKRTKFTVRAFEKERLNARDHTRSQLQYYESRIFRMHHLPLIPHLLSCFVCTKMLYPGDPGIKKLRCLQQKNGAQYLRDR